MALVGPQSIPRGPSFIIYIVYAGLLVSIFFHVAYFPREI